MKYRVTYSNLGRQVEYTETLRLARELAREVGYSGEVAIWRLSRGRWLEVESYRLAAA